MVSVRLPVLIALLAFGCSSSDRIPKEETRSQLALAAIDAGVSKVASDATGDLAHAGEIAAEVARIQTYLDSRYTANDIWRTFETKLGQTIDCIDWFAQPSVRALAAAGTPVTKIPTPVMPSKGLDAKTQYMPDWGFDGASDKNGVPRACPPETAPFVRVTVDEILAAGGLEYYLIRHSKSMPDDSEYSDTYTHDRMRFNHSNAQIYYGVGTLQIDSPTLRSFNQDLVRSFGSHSISQLWMMRGNADYDSTCPSSTPYRDRTTHNCTSSNWTQTVEAGWEINAGSSRSLFFIFTTNDGYRCGCWPRYSSCSTPCANTPQPFVYNAGNIWPVDGSWLPVNPDPVHGWVVSELANVSIYNSNGTWHVIVGGVDVGYYPNNWFSGSMRTLPPSSGSEVRFTIRQVFG